MRYVQALKLSVFLLPFAALMLLLGIASSRADDSAAADPFEIAGLTPMAGHKITVYPTGAEYTEARLRLIRGAKRTIYWAAFSWEADKLGRMYLDELCKRGLEGVDVRILLDKLAGHHALNLREQYRHCNIHMLGWDEPYWGLGKMPYALHEKLLIVDGEHVLTGGSAQRDKYAHASRQDPVWHDMDTQFDGPVACWFHKRFGERWGIALQRAMNASRGFVDGEGSGSGDAAILARNYGMGEMQGCEPVVFGDGGGARVAPVYNDPSLTQARPIREAYIKIIHEMRKGEEIRIFSSYFIPDQPLIDALNDAAHRGIRVRVLSNSTLSNDESNDISMAIVMSAREVMKEGVEVSVWTHTSAMHRKGIIFGNRIAVVGSDNFDKRSQNYSSEAVVFSDDPQFISTLTHEWELDIADARRYDVKQAEEELGKVKDWRKKFIRWIRKYY